MLKTVLQFPLAYYFNFFFAQMTLATTINLMLLYDHKTWRRRVQMKQMPIAMLFQLPLLDLRVRRLATYSLRVLAKIKHYTPPHRSIPPTTGLPHSSLW